MLTVHHLHNSQSERIPWLCEELEIPYDLKLYERDPIMAPATYKSLTAVGGAPVITDGDFTLSESGAVAEYIIHKYGSGRLALPPSHPDYANYLYWYHFANGSLQPAMAALFRAVYTGIEPDKAIYQIGTTAVKKALGNVEARVGRVRWLAGEEFTAADVMNFWSLTGMRTFIPIDLSGYPQILAYMERVASRKAYKVAVSKADPDREPCLDGPPPAIFKGLGKTYSVTL